MGVVYRGFDPSIERTVAIKTVHAHLLSGDSGDEFLARFNREAIAAGRCLHPNIVTVFEFGEDGGTPFIVFEYIEGTKLKKLIGKDISLSDIHKIVGQVLDALTMAHRHGVIHRDIKPDNIFICPGTHTKVSDFGIARLDSGAITRAGMMVGTPSYMSPEQIVSDSVDFRTDFYSTGVLLYEMLTGTRPFRGQNDTDIMRAILHSKHEDPRSYNPAVPTLLSQVVARALSKDLTHRFQDAEEFKAALDRAVVGAVETDIPTVKPVVTRFDEPLLDALEVGLLDHVGPIARILVRRTASTCDSFEKLLLELGYHIEDAAAREAFLKSIVSRFTNR